DDVGLVLVFERQAESQRNPLDRRELAVKRAIAFRIARHVVEKNRRRLAFAALGEHLRDRAHLAVPVGAADLLELAQFLHLLEPIAQAAVAHRAVISSHSFRSGHDASKQFDREASPYVSDYFLSTKLAAAGLSRAGRECYETPIRSSGCGSQPKDSLCRDSLPIDSSFAPSANPSKRSAFRFSSLPAAAIAS